MLLTPSEPILRFDGRRYLLNEVYDANLSAFLKDLHFLVPVDFPSDLASIPWFMRWLIPKSGLGLAAPLVHDYLCDRKGNVLGVSGQPIQLNSFDVHMIFLVMLRADRVSPFRSLVAFLGVLIGGPRWKVVRPRPSQG